MTQTKDMEVKQENAQTGETSEVRGMREKKKGQYPIWFVSKPLYIFDQLLCLRLKLICGYCLHASDHLLGVLVFAYLVIQRLYICADVPSGRLVLNEIQCWSRAKKINIQSCLL